MPEDMSFLSAKNGEIITKHDTVIKKDRKSLRDHLTVVIMGISIFNWPFFQDVASFDEGFSSYLDEYKMPGNKVLRKNNDVESKTDSHGDWFNAFNDLASAIGKFLMDRKETCWKWTGSQAGSGAQAFFAAKCGGEVPTAMPQKAQEVKPVSKAAAPKKAAPKEKKPVKEKDFRNIWTIENFVNDTVTLEGDDISHKHTVKVFSCKNIVFNVNGKVKSSLFEGCEGCIINIQSQVSPIELVNCKRCKIYATVSIPFVAFEKSQDCILNLTQETKKCVTSSNFSSCIKVKWPKDGAANDSEIDSDWCSFTIPEIYETRVGNDSAETTPYLETE
jgi:adenylyl cyclase-associated protein